MRSFLLHINDTLVWVITENLQPPAHLAFTKGHFKIKGHTGRGFPVWNKVDRVYIKPSLFLHFLLHKRVCIFRFNTNVLFWFHPGYAHATSSHRCHPDSCTASGREHTHCELVNSLEVCERLIAAKWEDDFQDRPPSSRWQQQSWLHTKFMKSNV